MCISFYFIVSKQFCFQFVNISTGITVAKVNLSFKVIQFSISKCKIKRNKNEAVKKSLLFRVQILEQKILCTENNDLLYS
jgi:hypothetical protein